MPSVFRLPPKRFSRDQYDVRAGTWARTAFSIDFVVAGQHARAQRRAVAGLAGFIVCLQDVELRPESGQVWVTAENRTGVVHVWHGCRLLVVTTEGWSEVAAQSGGEGVVTGFAFYPGDQYTNLYLFRWGSYSGTPAHLVCDVTDEPLTFSWSNGEVTAAPTMAVKDGAHRGKESLA